jgi:cyclic pyranopterin phosphate synthase
MVPMFSIVARSSGTGKTTVMEKLILELTQRGWKVGAVKNASREMHLDHPGKDSWRFEQAGAQAIAIITEDKAALICHTAQRWSPQDVAPLLGAVDLLIIEGYKEAKIPKVEVVRKEKGEEVVTAREDLVAVVTDVADLDVAVPVFSLEETAKLADFVEEKFIRSKASLEEFSHFDSQGRAHMVDVTAKALTLREAVAQGEISMAQETVALVKAGKMAKGDVLAVAQVAAVMGVKETSRLIPMCHPLLIGGVSTAFSLDEAAGKIEVTVKVKIKGQTGVEMEALSGVNTALLTIYDMCKAVDKNMVMGKIRLLEKRGGRSGHYLRKE